MVDFLTNVARQLGKALGLSSTSPTSSQLPTADSQLNFLIKVLQATKKSNGNPQVVYPLLQANLDKLDDNLAVLLRDWATATLKKVEQQQARGIAGMIGNFSILIGEFPQGSRATNLEIAITGYEVVATVFTREAFPQQWAMTQNNLANAYLFRIRGQKADNLEDAIKYFQAALQVRTRKAFPVDWATTQNNLGNAYLFRIRGQKVDNLEAAIKYFQAALQVRTRKAFPQQWADTQNNLGNAYGNRIRGQKADNLEAAIKYFKAALEVCTREAFPTDWAMTQDNLGNAYLYRIRGQKVDNLEAAIKAYQAALQVRTREAFPIDWATTQNNLGNAYLYKIRGEKAENLEAAINAYQAALQVLTREAFPTDWASTQHNLAAAYSDRIRGQKVDNLEAAIKYFQGALQVRTREAFPTDWAMTQHNLGNAYRDRIRGQKVDNLEDAINAFQGALQVYTREAFPTDWAMTQHNLGNAYSDRIRGQKVDNLEDAINAFQGALQVYTREAFPQEWATTKFNLGNDYLKRIRGQKADNLEAAINAFQGALQVFTREAFPKNHTETKFSLGRAYQDAQQLTNAYNAFAEAIETVESLRGEIVSGSGIEADKQKLAEEWHKLYRRMVTVCLELDKPTEAIEYVERSKGRNLVEWLTDKNLYPKRDRYPNLEVHQAHCQQLKQLRQEIIVIQRELEIFTINRESEEKYRENIKTNQERLKGLKQQQDNLLKEINQLDDSFRFTQQVETIPFSDIQSLIDDHTAIIEWYITPNQILTFIITPQNQHPQVKKSSSEDWQALIDLTFNEYLITYYEKKDQWETNLDNLLSQLAQILHIEEILAELPQKCDQLILIPHRFLHLLPLHALPIQNRKQEANNKQYGVADSGYDFAPLTPQFWGEQNSQSPPKLGDLGGLSKTKQSRIYTSIQQPQQNTHTNNAYLLDLFPKGVRYAPSCQLLQLTQNQERPHFSTLFAIQNPTNDSYKNLYYADLEVNNILPLFPFSQVLAKQDATEAAVKTSQEMPLSHCNHFSCHGQFHGQFDRKSPQESALILAKDDSPEDGQLTLAEIFGLSLNQCRLVTLSACETGITAVAGSTADQYSSDEYISLPSGFLYAGSPSVVSSLWTVNDFATAFLMIKFYQNLSQFPTRETGAVAVALNQAQTWLREVTKEALEEWTNHLSLTPTQEDALFYWFEDEETKEQPFQSPYYWAAFCAIGN